ncbi:hypothetical protein L873DRAFT_1697598 [Choiromyces venosus 120613-1]|uniref:GRIP domain-containing protein n=1 Tax=Choiromyces venosus 120613-1 TaxID=1336337 RepID=A0A3N4JBD5_9PEZI|nr:hypothetical protein L873DRAFT_1697598 [Choiromyces venosus 120613-1]
METPRIAPGKKKGNKKKKNSGNTNERPTAASHQGAPNDKVHNDNEVNGGSNNQKGNSLASDADGSDDEAAENSTESGDAASAGLREEIEKEKRRSKELENLVENMKEAAKEKESKSSGSAKESAIQESLKKHIKDLEMKLSTQQAEAATLHKSLADQKEASAKDLDDAEKQLASVEEEKKTLDTQYKTLLGRVATIKSNLGERLKSDAEELERCRAMVEDLEDQNRSLNENIQDLHDQLEKSQETSKETSKELTVLRNRMNLSQQNWAKEREDLISAEQFLREEYETTKHAMQDWEVIALEERAVRESLGERLIELEDQISTQRAAYAQAVADKERESNAVAGLQRSLQDIQNVFSIYTYMGKKARKQELRDVVESMQAQISQLIQKGELLEKRTKGAESQLLQAQQDLERVLPFEKEVKEKGLLIGKLRHEAVTLNDHLRKALRMLKRDNADDKIDKQLVTNVFLQFVSIQRGDTKKYEVLQLISSVLDWNDEQREKAGLVRPGTAANSSSSTLKTPPLSPFHRSPSTPTLSDAYDGSKDVSFLMASQFYFPILINLLLAMDIRIWFLR